MVMLYRRTDEFIEYWEADEGLDKVEITTGRVGRAGRNRTVPIQAGETATRVIARETGAMEAKGFAKIRKGDFTRIIVQYVADDAKQAADLQFDFDFSVGVALVETGNGDSDKHDSRANCVNVYARVLDLELARKVIVKQCKQDEFSPVTIAIAGKGGHRVLWPKNFKGSFSLQGSETTPSKPKKPSPKKTAKKKKTTPLDEYKQLIDDLVAQREDVSAAWVRGKRKWPNSADNKPINDFLRSLKDAQRDVLADMLQHARDGGIHDVLGYLNERGHFDKLKIVINGRELPHEPFGSEFNYDWTCRKEGDDWPEPNDTA
jgi:hypothetical protein